MKPNIIFSALLLGCSLAVGAQGRVGDTVQKEFTNPPASARPHTWWHWINGNITDRGITADLEAMKQVGIGGAQIFNVDVGIPAGKTPFMTPRWNEAVQHAIKEAHRLGLEICVHNCAGWSSSGGPWIKPEYAMQFLTWSETTVHGPMRFSGALPTPKMRNDYYRDIAVIAVRKPERETDGNKLRISGIAAKAAFERGDHITPDNAPTPEGMATPRDGVIVLPGHPDSAGNITWNVPAGDWTLLRMGHTPTGETNHPAPAAGLGLECDKLSREAMDVHWAGMMAAVLKDAGPLTGKSLNNALIDSYEVGTQNWTPKFREMFRNRCGYDPLPWLPVVTGRVVGSVETSERFLWDFRRTICDLFAENYFGYFGELCRRHGMKFSVEPYGNGAFDNLQAGGLADIPMGEFWIGGAAIETAKLASSAAHITGRKVVGAESFTADDIRGRWLEEPYGLKALGDRAFALGINRYIFHRYAHQPWLTLKPGMTMGPWGTHLERTTTWWKQSAAWMRYIARCQYLLQSGRFVADVLYFTGDEGPNDLPGALNQSLPYGYDYDGCDRTVLQKARVENGQIVLPSGMRYRVLLLPDSAWMTPATLRKIGELVKAGGTVVGPRPSRSPSLKSYPACDTQIKHLADTIWGAADGKTVFAHRYGKGVAIQGRPLADVLASRQATPDVRMEKRHQSSIVWLHRRSDQGDFYFVANQRYTAQNVDVSFRVAGKQPELWYPETGRTGTATVWREKKGRTILPLRLGPAESVFVVFRQPAAGVHLASVIHSGKGSSQKAAPRITIEKAMYEATDGAGGADVTQKVAGLVASGETSIPATNALFGDPISLHVKHLRIVYRLNGKRVERTAEENQTLELADGGDDAALPEYDVVTKSGRPTLQAWSAGKYTVKTSNGVSKNVLAPAPSKLAFPNPWTLRFPPNQGAPAQVRLSHLLSWPKHKLPGVRYFSGTATYNTTFEVPAAMLASNRALYLDLGRVKNFAEVSVNGKRLETLWKAPFRLDVTGLVKPGKNALEVRVTNLWPNRLIGDEQLPEEVVWQGDAIKEWPQWLLDNKPRPKSARVAFTTWRFWHKDSPLLESGLLGPVTLQSVTQMPLAQK